MRALHTAATGMMAQELNVQVISNNIAIGVWRALCSSQGGDAIENF